MSNYKDFTIDEKNYANLPVFVDELHDKGRKVVVALVILLKILINFF